VKAAAIIATLMTLTALQQAADAVQKRVEVVNSLHAEQRAAIYDASPLRAWQCDRRAGKTFAAIADFCQDGLNYQEEMYAYVALTRLSAEKIAWPILRKINRQHNLGMYFQEAKLVATLPTGSSITLYGADRPQWMDRLYGQKLRKVYIDEAAFFSINLEHLVYDILEPTVADLEGQITLLSRVGNFCHGLFYEIMCTDERKDWSPRKWSWQDNPHMVKQVTKLIERKKEANPDIENDPTFRRTWRNKWVKSDGHLVYRSFNPMLNGVDEWPDKAANRYVLGVDLGWFDHTAFSVVCWSPEYDELYEVESYRQAEMEIPDIASRCNMYMDHYPGIRLVGDPDRRQAFMELRRRMGIPLVAAEKQDKRHWVDLINADFAANKIRIVNVDESGHALEMAKLVWDQRPSGKIIERPGLSNDACDAFLYAYRFANHWRYEEPDVVPEMGTAPWYKAAEAKLEEEMEDEFDDQLG
jgi:hypothetical protein